MNKDGYWENLIRDGKTQAIFDYKESIVEKVYVETDVDTDGDGKLDLVAVYIRAPKEILKGLKVPAIYIASPYMMKCNENWYVPHSVDEELKVFEEKNILWSDVVYDFSKDIKVKPSFERKTAGFAEFLEIEPPEFEGIGEFYSYFLSRGYAIVLCGGLGTQGSQGFTLTGSREEVMAFSNVIDWMCGRKRAFTNMTDNIERKADWCSGKIAMSGKSYLGTMCVGVATTGVDGLETIIPEAAISNWYEYYRSNGLVVPALDWQGDDLDILAKYCFSRALDEADYKTVETQYKKSIEDIFRREDRDSGNYNKFWDERNYLNEIKKMKSSALIIHGINDWNVKLNQSVNLWNAMRENNLDAKMLLHQGDHIYIYDMEDSPALRLVHQWLDYYLYGIENGVLEEPRVWSQSNVNPSIWTQSNNFPSKEVIKLLYPINEKTRERDSDEESGKIIDSMKDSGYDRLLDNQKQWLDDLVKLNKKKVYCLNYNWDPFSLGEMGYGKESLRISGEVTVDFCCKINRNTAILSAMLVEYADEKRLTVNRIPSGRGFVKWGLGTPEYEEMKFDYENENSSYRIISRGHINAQNLKNNWSKSKIEKETTYNYHFSMIPTDYILGNGKKIGLIIYGTDPSQTLRPEMITEIVVDETSILVEMPIIV